MNVCVLSFCDALDVHLVRRLRSEFPALNVIRIVSSARTGPRASLWSKISLVKLGRRVEGAMLEWLSTRTRRALNQTLLGTTEVPVLDAVAEVESREINSTGTAELLTRLAPDILIVSGAPILKEAIFSIPKIATVNVHYGVAPQYRGEDTIFWALYFADYDHIGVTLHHITPRIDGGRILAIGRPALAAGDNEASLFAKCAELAARLALEVAVAARQGVPLEGIEQTEKGRLFLKRQRRIWHEIRSVWTRARQPLPSTCERISRHYE